MSDSPKPASRAREFWINKTDFSETEESAPSTLMLEYFYHVVEKTYVDQLESKLKKAIETLEFCSIENSSKRETAFLAKETLEEIRESSQLVTSVDYSASIPLEDVKKLCEALEYYQGNFNGKDGTKWRDGMLFVEDKFGSTEDASSDVASMALSTILTNFPQLKEE